MPGKENYALLIVFSGKQPRTWCRRNGATNIAGPALNPPEIIAVSVFYKKRDFCPHATEGAKRKKSFGLNR
jgi:hypothetical protein